MTNQVSLSQVKKQNIQFDFNDNVTYRSFAFEGENIFFTKGIDGQALSVSSNTNFNHLSLANLPLDGTSDFSIQFWVKTTSDKPTVILSQKGFLNKSIKSQKNPGWAIYSSGGTFAWAIGSGKRRLNYERDNGNKMPLTDGSWHQLTMTYNKELSEIRLYYDGHNKAVYKVGFDFHNGNSLVIGSKKSNFNYTNNILPSIENGAQHLQALVNEFNKLEVENTNDDEFLSLIVEPKDLYIRKLKTDKANTKKLSNQKLKILDKVYHARDTLLSNTYTIFQNKELTKLKPISKLYSLQGGKVIINKYHAKKFTLKERLYPSDFSMDNLSVYRKTLSSEEVLNSYTKYRESSPFKLEKRADSLTVAVWNIWHGGKHFTVNNNDWDSRLRIVDMLKKNNADIILMQETYSSGDFIAAELGYYFATTSDWDYRSQGSNISVISRYPIKELNVPPKAEFMNVAVKLAISDTQEVYAMSNWYGMSSFSTVYDFHKDIFEQTDTVPVFFGGDFNAIPHTDGGDSPASITLLQNGFTDAYRSLYPDSKLFPGFTHEWSERIDQLYYKGNGLKNEHTEVISTWFGGFPSDHHMILSRFKLE